MMLERILEQKRKEIKALTQPSEVKCIRRSLYASLVSPNREIGLIAEIKKASPSKGLIKEKFFPHDIAEQYIRGQADAISVLTDETFFQGHMKLLTSIKQSVNVPVLRKDFILEPSQVEESYRIGADAILLIGEALAPRKLFQLYQIAEEMGLEVLVEVHDHTTLEGILEQFVPKIIGVNNRNLETFETSLSQTEKIISGIPKECLVVSESGIHTYEDIKRVKKAGAKAVLVGESLMRQTNHTEGIKKLMGDITYEQH